MESDNKNEGYDQAKQLQQLFDEKVLDRFIDQCEKLIKNGTNLREYSSFYKLDYDMEEQYQSMKKVLAEA